ncbi:MAG: hypothetical protein ACJ71T_16640 [Actinomycetales bacterium]
MHVSKKRTLVAVLVSAAALTTAAAGAAGAQAGVTAPTAKAKVASHQAPDPTFAATERLAAKGVVATDASKAALATVEARVRAYVTKNGTKYAFGTYSDPKTGRVVLDTDAPASVVASLTNLSTAKSAAGVGVTTHRVRTTDAFNRRDDIPNYYGGGGLTASGFLCSTGYAVQNSAGTRFMVTAGHCFANGTTVFTESGLHTEGVVANRRLASLGNGPIDMELLTGQGYWGRVFTGGVTSSTSAPVVAAGAAFVGYTNYCHSGRTTGEQCGHTANSTTAQVCTTTGCKSPVIAYTGGVVQQGGDSGGAFYAKDSNGGIWIRGHVIAGNSTTGYVEPWTQVASTYGVSIVTG